MKIYKKYKKTLNVVFLILLIIIPMSLSAYFRYQPSELPLLNQQAEVNVISYYKSQITQEVKNKYAYLPPEKQTEMVEEQLSKLVAENADMIKEQVDYTTSEMKEGFQNEDGDTYLIAIDPWMQYKYTKNYIETGTVGDTVIDGKAYNTLRDGRTMKLENNRFHPWLMAKLHKLFSLFNPNLNPMRTVFLFPLIWVTISIIPAFFIGRRLSNNLGGFITATLIAVNSVIMSRTVAGFSDTDAHNVFFPLFIFWIIIEAYYAVSIKRKSILGGVAGLLSGIYAMAWSGWWYTFDFIILSIVSYIIYKAIKEHEEIKNGIINYYKSLKSPLVILGTYFGSTAIFTIGFRAIFIGGGLSNALKIFSSVIRMPFKFLQYQDVGITTIWPNVLTTVAELNPTSLQKVISAVGPIVIFFMAILGIYLVALDKKLLKTDIYFVVGSLVWAVILMLVKDSMTNVYLFLFLIALPVIIMALWGMTHKTNLKLNNSILLVIFITGTFLAATKGIRFIALFIPFVAMGVGIAGGKSYELISTWLTKSLNLNKILVRIVIIVLLLWVVLPIPIQSGWNQTIHEIPSYNDAWDNTLKIVNQTSEDAIITSWWDFGHWFVAGSERRVTFDGGSQSDRIHWVGKTLLTNNEKESIDVLRMLNCGQTNAIKLLEADYDDDYKAVTTLYRVISEDKDGARKILEESGLSSEKTNEVLKNTHCDNLIDQYFIASEDMIGKSGVWGHFGIWDFDRANLFNKIRSVSMNEGVGILTNEYNYSESDAKNIYVEIQNTNGDRWISSWPSFISGINRCSQINETTMACESGLIFNIKTEEAFLNTAEGLVHPKKISYIYKGEFKVKNYEDGVDVGVALFPSGDKMANILMQPELTASMFTRMYFFNGLGLEHYKQISHKVGIDGVDIYLYKVNLDSNGIIG